MNINIVIPGIPQPKQSFRVAVRGGYAVKYQSRDVIDNERSIKLIVKEQLPEGFIPTDKPVIVKSLIYSFPAPKSMNKRDLRRIESGDVIYKSTKPDLTDNLNKALFDAMQGIVYLNDSQICRMQNVAKVYGREVGIRLELEIT